MGRLSSTTARGFIGAAAIAAAALIAGSANASVLFTGSGLNPEAGTTASGSALFDVSGSSLTILLTNLTDPRTASQGNALTGVTFDVIDGAPALALSSVALGPGSALWTSKTASNTSTNLNGSWTSVLGSTPLGEFGAATTGFDGAFHGGSISKGNSSPNYGIVADGTFDGTNVSFGGSQFPFVQSSLLLTFSGANGLLPSQIGNVKLLFGTDGTGVVSAQSTIPGPATAALGAIALGLLRRRRR